MFRRKIFTLTVVAVVSFIILCGVQFFLLYNTYKLKNAQYHLTCAASIEKAYGNSIKDDKVYPGGAAILDSYILGRMDTLEKILIRDTAAFRTVRQQLGDSVVRALREKNNMDSVLAPVLKSNPHIGSLQYGLYLSMLEICFSPARYYPLYTRGEKNIFMDEAVQTSAGALIGGTLREPAPTNSVVEITVASGNDHSYRLRFALFADTGERRWAIIRLMMPAFLLSVFSILSVMVISYLAFRNWGVQKQLSEMKSDFINSITHEFHTPLATIIIANRTLQNKKLTTHVDHIDPLANVIERQSHRLKSMIQHVLDITTMNKIIPDSKLVSVHGMLEDIIQDYRVKQDPSHFDISLGKHAQSDTVMADPFWFSTIVINILDNAVKYNDKEVKGIEISTSNFRKHLLVEMRDNGCGMDESTRKYIFEKFYRAPDQVKKESKGLGLGLYYVKMAVQAHRWKIEVDSRPGVGSVFSLIIPLNI
ncbi:HAMP domain-containing sensor histidine kinase [Flavitalea sp. BT771]|uniref:sensor histidine kinase n=1 Tax=Flavitalea sp. BT771 TaxID=3063329 RepID=UPI0026E4423E|nr:HAMP domain-containing sensor histidine kinase [Flavitalea sp. BT771]MDO6435688.1 HAMP domain-containing sensor histidine kinase [Flavitalea sp. BT771]MDV6224589.1 HAMP domain-containing sensor histidine kinase [Flavitalea sp. BT771]